MKKEEVASSWFAVLRSCCLSPCSLFVSVPLWFQALLLVLVLSLAPAAAQYKAEKDFAANDAWLDTHFAKYGPAAEWKNWIEREQSGFRFKLPAGAKKLDQSGMYSHFSLAGDFELSAVFSWIVVHDPKKGYGVSSGIAVDAKLPAGAMVSLQRTFIPEKGKGHGYGVTVGKPGEKGAEYTTEHFPTQAKSGTLILKRERKELICLVADKPKEEPRELTRVPFTDGTISKVRVFADPGGSPSTVDAWVGRIQVKAEEIPTTGIAKKESEGGVPWLVFALVILLAAGAYGWWRRGKETQE